MTKIDKNFSTTKLLIEGAINSSLFLPKNNNRKLEGGLRFKKYYKKSHINKPLISIITVVFNGEQYLEETIKSVINQTYDNIEYIIIDGYSRDDTCKIIQKYEYCIDYYVSEKDYGIYDAMNKGVEIASGDVIAFLNADDWYELNAISNIAKIFTQKNIDFTYGDLNVIDSNLKIVAKFYAHITKWKRTMPFGHPTLFVKSSILKDIPFDLKYKVISDYDFILKLMQLNLKHEYIHDSIANFRIGGISSNMNLFIEVFPIHKKHFGLLCAIKLFLHNYTLVFLKKSVKTILPIRYIRLLKKTSI